MDGQRIEKNFSRPYLYVYTYGLLRLERNSSLQASESCASAVPQKEWEERPGPTLALLKLLICSENRHGAKNYLAGTLWPDTEEEKARHSLAQASRVLRGVLRNSDGKSLLIETSGGSGLQLADQTSLWVDADAFEQEVQGAIRAERDGRMDSALSYWERAYELGNAGTFLPDDIYQEWTNARRLNHDRLYRRCVHRLGECYLAQARYDDAEAILRPFWVNHLTEEDILFLLMKVAIARGDRSEAFWFYERTKQALQNELGVQPLASVTSLVEQLRTNAEPSLPAIITLPQDQQEIGRQAFLPLQPAPVLSDQRTLQHLLIAPANTILTLPPTAMQRAEFEEMGIPDCATRFGLLLAQMIALIEQWCGMAMFCHDLQYQLDGNIKALETLKMQYSLETYLLARRSFLTALAALPVALLTSNKQAYKLALNLEEFLPRCAASITACWHLSGGSHLDTITPLIDSYLPTLLAVLKNSSSYRVVAAELLAQCYSLKAILAWHREGLESAEVFCSRARHYSDIAENSNLQLTALNQHALILFYARQFPKALAKSEEAENLLQHTPHEEIFPIVQGRVYMYLAALQAQQASGKAEQTLELAQKAFTLQAATADPVPLYADCGNAPLLLWDGLTHYYLGSHSAEHTKQALTSLSTFGQLESNTEIAERFRLECLNSRTLAAIQLGELNEAIGCFQAGKQGARELESKQRDAEVAYAYQKMFERWPKEERVQRLAVGSGK